MKNCSYNSLILFKDTEKHTLACIGSDRIWLLDILNEKKPADNEFILTNFQPTGFFFDKENSNIYMFS